MTREEHLQQCKRRALAYVEEGKLTHLSERERNGAFLINDIDPDNSERHKIISRHDILPNYPDIDTALGRLF